MKTLTSGLLASVLLSALATLAGPARPVAAQGGPNCSPPFLVDVTFGGGARWQMCWEHRTNEGIVFYDVYFTSPGQPSRPVLAQAGLAQIHVPYDDNGARFHDLSDYGLGNDNMNDLTPAECPGGSLLQYNSKDVLCKMVESHSYYYKYYSTQAQAGELVLFSVSHIGQYNYVPRWSFGEDGHINVEIGATGRLQRFGNNSSYGWPIQSGNNPYGISHMHNLYWRLDFDVGDKANDLAEEIEFLPTPDTARRTIVVTGLTTEAARQVSPTTMRMWRVRDTVIVNTDNRAISYQIEPTSSALYRGPSNEPFTQNDFYATLYKACEKWASHNPTTGGCTGRDDVSDFVDGESIDGQDVVIWYSVHFHHTPRDEDQPNMPIDWHGFHIQPRDWSATSPVVASPTPTITASPTPTQTATPTITPTPTNTPVPLPTACARGDANCDGLVDAGDLACVVMLIFNGAEACAAP